MYYVYAYLRSSDLTPYYIGKGSGNRAFSKQHNVNVPTNADYILFMETNLTEVGSLAIERRMIKWYGRKDIGTGILRNQTDGGDAPPNHTGMKRSADTKQRLRESHKGFTGLKHTTKSKNKWVHTRRQNGSYIPTIEQLEHLRNNRKAQGAQFSKPVCIFGTPYGAIKEACEALNMGYKAITNRLKSDKFTDCYYI